ncbi:MAG: branched-chain amino acid ABC transporter substrate-binding protein [Actinobacteria bacterium]|nr:branched-chain amino acid ABC transporter substrate-binding protein [Actinomycetota bacterium]
MKRAIALALAAGVAAVLAANAVARPASETRTSASQAVSCKSTLKIALVTPLTGGAGFLGNAQLTWAKYAVKTLAPKMGLKVRLITGDTPVEQGPAPAQALAQKYVADRSVVAVIGPATSGAVAATSKAYADAGLAHISPSATRTSLTQGSAREATPAFFRVVPGDYIQGPSDARFMIEKLKVTKVVIIDFQEPYSVGLADAAQVVLRAKGVNVIRESTSVKTTDYSSLVTKVPSDAQIVFFPTQQPEDAQTFGQQLLEQGKRAKVFGGDGSNSPDKFKLAGSYVSNFAPDISGIAYNKALIAGWKKDNPSANLESFGPPTYGAVQVALNAVKRACTAGKGQIKNRRDVVRNVKRGSIKNWILGGTFRFSTKSNDPLNAKFYIFQIQSNGSYKLVG